MTNTNHGDHILGVREEFTRAVTFVEGNRFDGNTSIDLVAMGMVVRALESTESMICLAGTGPDNTLYLLLRNLFETSVRLRYLANDPNVRVHEYLLADCRSRLAGVGREPVDDEDMRIRDQRQSLLEQLPVLEKLVAKIQDRDKPFLPNLERMCQDIGDQSQYRLYRVLSQFEHSTGMGLVSSVIERASDSNSVVFGRQFNEEELSFVWDNCTALIGSIPESIEILNAHRPDQSSET